MKKKRFSLDVEQPDTVNADHQMIPVIYSDVMGSYTGLPQDALDKPVQDVDDL